MVMSRPSAAKKPFFLPSQIGAVSTIGMTPTLILVRPGLPPAAGLALLEAPHALSATTESVASPASIDFLTDRFIRHSIVAGGPCFGGSFVWVWEGGFSASEGKQRGKGAGWGKG